MSPFPQTGFLQAASALPLLADLTSRRSTTSPSSSEALPGGDGACSQPRSLDTKGQRGCAEEKLACRAIPDNVLIS